MWVATGVAAEKSSRVMELMISAASPRQMLTGKVVGIGARGSDPVRRDRSCRRSRPVAFQDRIAEAVLGPAWAAGAPLVGLTPGLLLGYGVFFLLGFTLFALIYASMGSFVSRPDDLQTLSLPLSLVAMAGYLSAIVALGGGGGAWIDDRVVPAAVQPVRDARPADGLGGPAVAGRAVDRDPARRRSRSSPIVATRMYAAGVLLYGQRPGVRAFVAAARKALTRRLRYSSSSGSRLISARTGAVATVRARRSGFSRRRRRPGSRCRSPR